MARYQSKLESLQKLREQYRDSQRVRLAEVLAAEEVLNEQIETMTTELGQLEAGRRAALEDGRLEVNSLLNQQRYELLIQSRIATLRTQAETLAAETDRRRASLSAADQGVRVLEKVDDRRRELFEVDQRKREQQQMDELALQQYMSRRRSKDNKQAIGRSR